MSISLPGVDIGRHNKGLLDGVLNFLGSDPSYTRWLPLAFSPQVSSQPFRTANSAALGAPWGNMNCIYGIHVEQEVHRDLTGGGILYTRLAAPGYPVGTPFFSTALGSTTFHRVVVDANGDRINVNDPDPLPNTPPPTAAVPRTGHTDVFSSIDAFGSTITVNNAGPPGAIKQKGNYKYVFSGGYLQSIEDTFGNKQTFSYGTNPGDPYLTVSDLTSGRQLFFYLGSGGYIEKVVAPYLGTSSPAVTTRLSYDSTGHMTASRVYFQNNNGSPVHEDLYAYAGDQLISASQGGTVQTSTFVMAPSKDGFGFDIPRLASTTYGDSSDSTSSDDGYGVDGTFGYSYSEEMATNGEVAGHTTTFTDARYASGKSTTWYSSIYDSTNTGYFKMTDLVLPPLTGAIDPVTTYPSTETKVRTIYQPNINNPTNVEEIDPLGKSWKTTLSGGLPLTFQDPLFNTTTLTWGGASGTDLLSLTGPDNLQWQFEYTPTGGRVTKVTDPAGQVRSTATYNAFGQLATETVPAAVASSGQNETTSYTYDGTTGDLLQIEEPHGAKTFVGLVNPATHTLVPNTSYDPLGDPLTFSVFPDTGDPATSSAPLSTQLTWNAAQEMTQAILGNGLRLVNTYDQGKKTKVQTFDPYNTVLSETNYSYDTRGRVYQVSDLVGIVAKYRYDKNDNLTKVIDGRGNASYVQYGQNNEPTASSSDGGYGSDSVLYDAAGRVRESTDKRGVVFQFAYDDAGKLTGVTIPAQTSDNATYSYDAAGRPLSVTRANGDSIVYTYTGANKWLTSVTTTVGSRVHVVSYTYNGDGLRSSMTSTVTGGHSRTTSYQWDRAGRLVSESTAGFGTTGWIYDFAGRMLSQITTTPLGARIGTIYTWGTSGLPGDPSTAPAYLSRITNTVNSVDTVHWDMTHDLLGQVKSVTGQRANGDTQNAVYTYDGRGRLTGETRAHTVNGTPYSGTSSYTYDLADNLNSGGNGWSYDADNRITSAPSVGGMPGATGLSHDAAGNLTSIDGKTLTYDALGQLSSVAVPNSGTVTITYDPAGRRFSSTDVNGVTTYSDYDGNQLIGRQTGSSSSSPYADIIASVGTLLAGAAQYETYGPNGAMDGLYTGNGASQGTAQQAINAYGAVQEGPGTTPFTGIGGRRGNHLSRDVNTGIENLDDAPDSYFTGHGGLIRDGVKLFQVPFAPHSEENRKASQAISNIPGLGTALKGYRAVMGKDPISGDCVSVGDRIMDGFGALGDGLGALGKFGRPFGRGKPGVVRVRHHANKDSWGDIVGDKTLRPGSAQGGRGIFVELPDPKSGKFNRPFGSDGVAPDKLGPRGRFGGNMSGDRYVEFDHPNSLIYPDPYQSRGSNAFYFPIDGLDISGLNPKFVVKKWWQWW